MVYLLFVPTQGGGMEIIMRIKKLIIGLMTEFIRAADNSVVERTIRTL